MTFMGIKFILYCNRFRTLNRVINTRKTINAVKGKHGIKVCSSGLAGFAALGTGGRIGEKNAATV